MQQFNIAHYLRVWKMRDTREREREREKERGREARLFCIRAELAELGEGKEVTIAILDTLSG